MTEFFLTIIEMSISASWIVLAVLLIRPVLRRAPKWVNVLLWCLVAVRLVCPFTIESSFSMVPQSDIVRDHVRDHSIRYDEAVEYGEPVIVDGYGHNSVNSDIVNSNYPSGTSATAEGANLSVFMIVWGAGIFFLLLYTVVNCLSLRRRIRTAVLYKENIFQSENVSAPFVFGIFRPRIYLPFKMDGQDLEHVIAHEKAHISRRDHWWKPFGFLLLAIHWFNPVMWLAYVLLCRDIELACDEKVIRKLNNGQRADYTQALLSCSVNRRLIAACPLAFGEVGVKRRVKSVLNYRKPGFWVIVMSIVVFAVVAVCFVTDPKRDSYDIKIVIPAGSEELFVYSDEEISPTKSRIIISSGDNLGDTEVKLKSVEVREENAYDEVFYLTPGMPVKMDVEKGAWFKIGINVQNPTEKDIVVSVRVKNVRVRIADSVSDDPGLSETASNGSKTVTGSSEAATDTSEESATMEAAFDLEDAISKAILEYDSRNLTNGMLHVESHFTAYTEEKDHRIIVYLQAYESSYYGYNGSLYQESGSNIPTALTFSIGESGEYVLEEYWIPRDGSYYVPDLKNKFPTEALEALNAAYEEIQKLGQECTDKAKQELERKGGLELRIAELIKTIQESPGISSNPQDYIEAHNAEYQELISYGAYSLRYCYSEFLSGGQTGLKGKIMEEVCIGIICSWGFVREDVYYDTGQDWFDTFRENTKRLSEQYSDDEIEKNYPASWILLEMQDSQ